VGGTLTVVSGNFLDNQGVGGSHGTLANPVVKVESAGNGAAILNEATLVVRDSAEGGDPLIEQAASEAVAGAAAADTVAA
jgi:hypothetical protein